jgi:hypothetical protein
VVRWWSRPFLVPIINHRVQRWDSCAVGVTSSFRSAACPFNASAVCLTDWPAWHWPRRCQTTWCSETWYSAMCTACCLANRLCVLNVNPTPLFLSTQAEVEEANGASVSKTPGIMLNKSEASISPYFWRKCLPPMPSHPSFFVSLFDPYCRSIWLL